MVAKRTAKLVIRYDERLIPAGDTRALIALASGPLAEVGMTVIGVILTKPEDTERPTDKGD